MHAMCIVYIILTDTVNLFGVIQHVIRTQSRPTAKASVEKKLQ